MDQTFEATMPIEEKIIEYCLIIIVCMYVGEWVFFVKLCLLNVFEIFIVYFCRPVIL